MERMATRGFDAKKIQNALSLQQSTTKRWLQRLRSDGDMGVAKILISLNLRMGQRSALFALVRSTFFSSRVSNNTHFWSIHSVFQMIFVHSKLGRL